MTATITLCKNCGSTKKQPLGALCDSCADEWGRSKAQGDPRVVTGNTPIGADNSTTPREKLRELPLRRLISTIPPEVEWVVERIVAPGALTLLAGVAGNGKSLVSMAFAVAATRPHGAEMAGIEVQPGPVLYLDAENGEVELHRRIHALGLDADAVERLTLIEVDGFDLRHDLHLLEALLAQKRPALIVLDSFRSLWGGDERDEAAVAAVLDPLRNLVRRQGAGALLIHHARRDGTGYRGSGAIAASCELAFLLGRQADDKDDKRRVLTCEKSRPAPEPSPLWLRLASEDDLLAGVPMIREAEPPSVIPRNPVTTVVKAQSFSELETYGPLTRPDIARRLGRSKSDQTIRTAFTELEEEGKIERVENDRWKVVLNTTPDNNPTTGVVQLWGPIAQDNSTTPHDDADAEREWSSQIPGPSAVTL